MLLEDHRALILLAAAACGDNRCPDPSSEHSCRVARIEAQITGGQLGFRFGEPLDLDGDGIGDVVAGARYVDSNGTAGAWSIRTDLGGPQVSSGLPLVALTGEFSDGLFGNVALAMPDLDGDGRNDLIVAGPLSHAGNAFGVVDAYALDGHRIWRATGGPSDGLGWQVSRTGDLDGDGIDDLWAGAVSSPRGAHAFALSGRDGHALLSVASPRTDDLFGWYVVPIGDLDGDGLPDVAIGAPYAVIDGRNLGAVTLASSASGAIIRELHGDLPDHLFGQMIAGLDDVDGDGIADIAVSAPGIEEDLPGQSEVHIISGATGQRLHLLTGEYGELYGRMVVAIDDLDGDGLRDLAIGAPWFADRKGRVEVRSSATLAVLAEIDGTEEDGWFGWHIAPSGRATAVPGLVISALHARTDAGTVEVHELR